MVGSRSCVTGVAISYIDHQVEHHRTRTFQEEYLAFLKAHEVKFDEKYL